MAGIGASIFLFAIEFIDLFSFQKTVTVTRKEETYRRRLKLEEGEREKRNRSQ